MYNKSWIVDGCVVIVGGCNIGEEYFSVCIDVNFQDLDLLVVGFVVEQVNWIFDDYWNSEVVILVFVFVFYIDVQLCLLVCELDNEVQWDVVWFYFVCVVELCQWQCLSFELLYWSRVVCIVLDLLMKYCRDDCVVWLVLILISELQVVWYKMLLILFYFVLGNEGLDGFLVMVGWGVQVGVVINLLVVNDVVVVYGGYMNYCVLLFEVGVYLYELKVQGQFGDVGMFGSSGVSLYIKVFVVDDCRGFVGLFNFDLCLVYFNIEMGVLFDDLVLGVQLCDEYLCLVDFRYSWWLVLDDCGWLCWLECELLLYWVEVELGVMVCKCWLLWVISWLFVELQLQYLGCWVGLVLFGFIQCFYVVFMQVMLDLV